MDIDMVRELKRVQYQQMRAREAGLPATLTLEEWVSILEYWHRLCAYCLTSPFEALDHVIPLNAGSGGTIAENCVPSCTRCNSRKRTRMVEMFVEDFSPEERVIAIRQLLHLNPDPLEVEAAREKEWPEPPSLKSTTLRQWPSGRFLVDRSIQYTN